MNRRRLVLLVLGSIWLAGCAGAGRATHPPVSPSLISRWELEALEPMSAFEAILRLRPRWLQPRGVTSPRSGPAVPRAHLDQSPLPSPEALRSIPIQSVQSIELLGAAEATTRFGTGYPAGLILVRTRR